MRKKCVAILFGGISSEHEVSLMSVESILNNIKKDNYNIIKIGITKKGEWHLYSGPNSKIISGEWESDKNNKKVVFSQDRSLKGIIVLNKNNWEKINIDVVFPVLHGKNGEDGTIQGLFELSSIPFVGCDTKASTSCMDKIITNIVLSSNGIKKPNFTFMWDYEFLENETLAVNKIESTIKKYPMFVKPANSGSSVGISKAENSEELLSAIKIAIKEDKRFLVEEAIVGKEVECAVLGNDNPIASNVGEIETTSSFYDYDAKYINNSSKLFIPARIEKHIVESIRDISIKAYRLMGCSGLSRIDFLIDNKTNDIFLNEINTLPGFTSISMYPKLFESSGISYSDLIDRLIKLALERRGDLEK